MTLGGCQRLQSVLIRKLKLQFVPVIIKLIFIPLVIDFVVGILPCFEEHLKSKSIIKEIQLSTLISYMQEQTILVFLQILRTRSTKPSYPSAARITSHWFQSIFSKETLFLYGCKFFCFSCLLHLLTLCYFSIGNIIRVLVILTYHVAANSRSTPYTAYSSLYFFKPICLTSYITGFHPLFTLLNPNFHKESILPYIHTWTSFHAETK